MIRVELPFHLGTLARMDAAVRLDSCGVYFASTGRQMYSSANGGDSWTPIVRNLPWVLSVDVRAP
jgi:hypothetical protein